MTERDPDDGDRRYDEIKNGDRPSPPQLRSRFRFREYPAVEECHDSATGTAEIRQPAPAERHDSPEPRHA